MSFAKLALDDTGRLIMNVATVANATSIAAQAYLMDAACADAGSVAAGDSFNAGFRYTLNGALRVYDATAGLPAGTNINQGIAMTDDGQACYTTDAIGADVARLNGMAVDSNGRIYATVLDPVAWFRFNIGITEAGQGVSVWADQSGEGNDLLQGTDGARPAKQIDGSILFNGTDEFLAATFTNNQPFTVYFLGRQITWTSNSVIVGFGAGVTRFIFQNGTTPEINLNCGSQVGPISLALGTYGVIAAVVNGASSSLKLNNGTPASGDAGANNGTVFNLGVNNQVSAFSNIQVKEVILFPVAHDAATQLHVIRYLAHNGPVTL